MCRAGIHEKTEAQSGQPTHFWGWQATPQLGAGQDVAGQGLSKGIAQAGDGQGIPEKTVRYVSRQLPHGSPRLPVNQGTGAEAPQAPAGIMQQGTSAPGSPPPPAAI